jgi:hypothetical protein
MTLRQFAAAHDAGRLQIPAATAWYLAELAEGRGKQELFTRQAPQRLKALRESAIVESAISSNRIEGVEVAPARIATVVFGTTRLRDRDEKEVRGYREALALIHERGARLPVSEATIRDLHARSRARIGDAGEYKSSDSDIVERFPDGRSRVRFRTVPHGAVPEAMRALLAESERCEAERWVPSAIALAAFNLDAYKEFETRVGQTRSPRGAKTELVRAAIDRAVGPFRVADLQHACPGVGLDLIRRVLKQLQREGLVRCLGRGPSAAWRRTDEPGSS